MAQQARKPRGSRQQTGAHTHIHVGGAPASSPNETPLTPDEEAVDEALAQLPENTVAKIYRIREDGQREYVAQTTPQAATEERCAQTGKSGKYVILFWGPLNDGTKRNGYKGQRTVFIGEDQAKAPAVASPPAPSGNRFDDMMATAFMNLMNAQAQQSQQHNAAMMALMSKLAAPPERDPILTAILTKVVGGGSSDPIEQATRIAELAKGGKSGTAEILQTLELVDRIREGGGGGNDGDGKPRGWLETFAQELAPLVADIVRDKMKPGAPNVDTERQLRLVRETPSAEAQPMTPAQPTQPTQPAAQPVVAAYLQPIAPMLTELVWLAEKRFSPILTAAGILDRINDNDLDTFAQILAQPSLVPDIVAAEPRLAPYQSWLDEVRRQANEQLEEDNDDTTASADIEQGAGGT